MTGDRRRYIDTRVYGDTPAGGKAHIVRVDGMTYCGRPVVGEYTHGVLDETEDVCGTCQRARRAVEAMR